MRESQDGNPIGKALVNVKCKCKTVKFQLEKYLAHCQEKISLRQEFRQVELR